MSKESRMEGVQGTGAGRKATSGSVGMGNGGRGPPPRKESGSASGAAPGHVVSGAGSSRAPGRHSAVRATARELERRSAQQPKRPRHPLFDFPPTFELAVSRQVAVRSGSPRRISFALYLYACALSRSAPSHLKVHPRLLRSSSVACSAQRRCSSRSLRPCA